MEFGVILINADGVSRVSGLETAFIGELVTMDIVKAMVLNLESYEIAISIFGDETQVSEGDLVERFFNEILIEVGYWLVSRVVDPAGNFLDVAIFSITFLLIKIIILLFQKW